MVTLKEWPCLEEDLPGSQSLRPALLAGVSRAGKARALSPLKELVTM